MLVVLGFYLLLVYGYFTVNIEGFTYQIFVAAVICTAVNTFTMWLSTCKPIDNNLNNNLEKNTEDDIVNFPFLVDAYQQTRDEFIRVQYEGVIELKNDSFIKATVITFLVQLMACLAINYLTIPLTYMSMNQFDIVSKNNQRYAILYKNSDAYCLKPINTNANSIEIYVDESEIVSIPIEYTTEYFDKVTKISNLP